MRVGVVTEIKPAERRVALTPAGAAELAGAGHEVLVQVGAGVGSGFADGDYAAAGARLVEGAERVWAESELLVKVKEPIASEHELLHADLTLFTYLHLAAAPELVGALTRSGATAIAYETVEEADGSLPLLAPMSEIAGRLAGQAGAYFLQHPLGGRGVLIGGAPGVPPARVVVIGGGVVGFNATRVAAGMGAEVTVLERSPRRLRELEDRFDGRVRVLMSDPHALAAELAGADVVIGAVLLTGAAAPKLITRELLATMRERAVIVDVAIDQGGCAETSRPTTHAEPTYVVGDVLHYCVANMPGAVPATSTRALTNATLPFVRQLADGGVEETLATDLRLRAGLNVRAGELLVPALMEAAA
jgi:alanine dehydrogenase